MGDAVTALAAAGADIVGTGNADVPVDGAVPGVIPAVPVLPVAAVGGVEDPTVVA